MRRALRIAVLLAALGAQAAFARSDGTGFATTSCVFPAGKPLPGSGNLLKVPGQYGSIQAAVNAAAEGDTILISPGIYRESVEVTTPRVRIRGTDRDAVVLDGESKREVGIMVAPPMNANGRVVGPAPDGVVIENMTAHNYTRHGFFWWHVTGYWATHLTAYDNGLYGIYAFDSRCGQIDHSYASGNADAGFYIGECFPCDAVITQIYAEENALGYSGTNAGGNLLLKDSVWQNNALGIVPNSLSGEDRPPQRGAMIKNNLILDNNNATAPGVSLAGLYHGVGVVIAGGHGNIVAGNMVGDHKYAGLALVPLPETNGKVWTPAGNTVWGNKVSHDARRFPESYDLVQGAGSGR